MKRPQRAAAAWLLSLAGVCATVSAQQPPAAAPPHADPNETLRSPELGSNGHVTFRLYAPDAQQVKLQAEGMEATPGISPQELTKVMRGFLMSRAENGVWSIDFGPVPPGVYR